MRLTYKYENSSDYGSTKLKNLPPDPLVDKLPYLDDAWKEQRTKLGQLEDIEEELGIDLFVLFRALKNGIYVKNRKNEIRRVSCNIGLVETGGHNSLGLRFQDTNYKWRYLVLDTSRDNDVKDYGETWALTKEELL